MSYILDALKKSDQQRQRGATPTLQDAPLTVVVTKRPVLIYYILLATVLLGAGILIGWLMQPEPVAEESTLASPTLPQATAPIAEVSPMPIAQQDVPAPLPPPPVLPNQIAQPIAAEPVANKPVQAAPVAPETKLLTELPFAIQQEIPAMSVQLHAYSNNPGERLVSINSIRLREGQSLMIGLRLEQITPDGMIFSYKGYRFQRGIR